jgi:hypothetical protein
MATLTYMAFDTLKKSARKSEKAQRKLMKDYMRAIERANRANETRYQAILGEQNSLYGRTMRGLETVGEAQRQQLREEDRRIQADARQGAISRGMAGTTVATSMQQAATRQTGVAARALEEEARVRKLNADANLTNQRLSFMERKVEQGPDPNVLRMQMQMAGQPGSGMQAVNRMLDEFYRLVGAGTNALAAMSGGSPAPPPQQTPAQASAQQSQAVAQLAPVQQQSLTPTTGGGFYSAPPVQSSQAQENYYGGNAYQSYMQQQSRTQPRFY